MEQLIEEIQRSATAKQWNKIGIGQHHGICVPLFSLHSKESAGIGEFPDLLPLLSWCKKIGLDTVQLLPLNDTGPNRSPYSAISSIALNPLHLGIAKLPGIQNHSRLMPLLRELQRLTQNERVDYQKVQGMRDILLKDYFQENGPDILASQEYHLFRKNNSWLQGYALFKSLKSQCNWQKLDSLPEGIQEDNEGYNLNKKLETDISYHSFLQFFCFQQLQQVKQHADSLGIFIKGDIPILIDRESADLWLHPSLFNVKMSAGAPPDAYSAAGQNWGFPLYNWEEMERTGFSWWKERLSIAEHFYHIYRIDHVVGFFRIWAIAEGSPATEGHFIPSPKEAISHGSKLMQMMIQASSMLPIGEDLGTVPNEVRGELKRLGICGTKVMRWERNWEGDKQFIKPEAYAPLSVTTVSTHDSSTLPLWWTQNSDEAREYCQEVGWQYKAPLPPEYQFAMMYTSHHTSSLFHINLLNEYLAIIPELVHQSPEDERINLPGIISDKNWSYRFIPSVEEIADNEELARLICDLKA